MGKLMETLAAGMACLWPSCASVVGLLPVLYRVRKTNRKGERGDQKMKESKAKARQSKARREK
jgi:hypothetical protein